MWADYLSTHVDEEISWGQRLLGLLPPSMFQELNFQQELRHFGQESRFQDGASEVRVEAVERNRRTYFHDPWHNPYWICMRGYGPILLYSFGPNRRRDTVMLTSPHVPRDRELEGDDVGFWLELWGDP